MIEFGTCGKRRDFTCAAFTQQMVNGERYNSSIVVLAEEVRHDWEPASFDELSEAHFSYFLPLKPEILLLGTGARQRFPHPRLYRALTHAGIALECMDTPAACRTYNILVAEDRKVLAAILL
jgi:uncharacterized protein